MSRTARQLMGFAVALLLCLVVWSMPAPAGLSPLGQCVMATLLGSIALWILGASPNEIVTILAIIVPILAGVNSATALSGFGNTSVWLMAAVSCCGFATAQNWNRVNKRVHNLFRCFWANWGPFFGRFSRAE